MTMKRRQIWVEASDREKMRNEVKKQFLTKYPYYDGKISDSFMFKKMIQFWFGELK